MLLVVQARERQLVSLVAFMPATTSFFCTHCKVVADSKLEVCLACGSHAGYWPLLHRLHEGALPDTRVVTSRELWAKRGKFLSLEDEWSEVLGALPAGAGRFRIRSTRS